MTRRVGLEIGLVLALSAALVASIAMTIRQSWQLTVIERQRAADLESLRKMQQILTGRSLPTTPSETETPATVDGHGAALAKRDAAIEQLNRELTDARGNISTLQAQLAGSTDEHEKAIASANEHHEKDQADWQSRLDNLKQELDSAQTELQASRERQAALEADNLKLNNENKTQFSRASDFQHAAAGLDDLDRRRDTYLTSILRRYRDITSQFRAMSGMLDAGHDPNSSAFSGEALTRIQNAIAQADDDLRQLSELNAQARQLEKKLEKK